MSDDLADQLITSPIGTSGIVSSMPLDQTRAELTAIYSEANVIADAIDESIGMAIAGCYVECEDAVMGCVRCIYGQLDAVSNDAETILSKFGDKLRNGVQGALSEAVGVALSVGIPIQELFPGPDDTVTITQNADYTITADISPTTGINLAFPAGTTVSPRPQETVVTRTIQSTLPDILPPTTTVVTITRPTITPTTSVCLNSPNISGTPAALSPHIYVCINQDTGERVRLSDFMLARGICYAIFAYNYGDKGSSASNPLILSPNYSLSLVDPNTAIFAESFACGGVDANESSTTTVTVCPTTTPTPPQPLNPGITGLCDPRAAEQILSSVVNLASAGVASSNTDITNFVLRGLNIDANQSVGITDLIRNPINTLMGSALISAGTLVQTIISAANAASFTGTECNSPSFTFTSIVSGIANLFGGWFGMIPSQVRTSNQYALNLQCQYLLPSGADANTMYSRGRIDEAQWRLLIHANGLCEPWQTKIVDAQKAVPNIDQTQVLFRRGEIGREYYKEYMERNGVKDQGTQEHFFQLSEYVPGPSDLVMFMKRDVFDPAIVTSEQLDSEFESKFQGDAERWAQSQGMSEQQFRYYWRSHWQYPSNTQLYEMLHRLRSDKELPAGLGVAPRVTPAEVEQVLRINDQAPTWLKRLIAISYRPLTRVDARRAFEIGELSLEELRDSYLDLGYSPEDADRLLKFSIATSGPVRSKRLGFATTTEVLGWYRDHVIPRDQAERMLEESGVKRESVSRYLDTEDARRTARDRREVVKAVRRRFNAGEYTVGEATSALSQAGYDPAAISDTLFQWSVIRDSKFKAPAVGMLCKWWSNGYITVAEYERRVTNLGYSLVDAARIMASCQKADNERKQKEFEKLQKEAIAKEEKRIRQQRAAQREAERIARELAPCKPPPKPTCPTPVRNGQAQGPQP